MKAFIEKRASSLHFRGKNKAPTRPLQSGWGWKQPAKTKIKILLFGELQNSDLPSLRKYHKGLLESGDLV